MILATDPAAHEPAPPPSVAAPPRQRELGGARTAGEPHPLLQLLLAVNYRWVQAIAWEQTSPNTHTSHPRSHYRLQLVRTRKTDCVRNERTRSRCRIPLRDTERAPREQTLTTPDGMADAAALAFPLTFAN